MYNVHVLQYIPVNTLYVNIFVCAGFGIVYKQWFEWRIIYVDILRASIKQIFIWVTFKVFFFFFARTPNDGNKLYTCANPRVRGLDLVFNWLFVFTTPNTHSKTEFNQLDRIVSVMYIFWSNTETHSNFCV